MSRSSAPFGRRRFLQAAGAIALAASGAGARRSRAAEKTEVLVLGAGLSGLHAALLLEEQGARVTVLEGSDRVGGRCRTLVLDGEPYDLGASEVGSNYGRTLDVARRVGVRIEEYSSANAETAFHVGGRLVSAKDWADSPANLTVGAERKVLPNVLEAAYSLRLNPFGDDVGAWLDPRNAAVDVAAGEYFRAKGVSDAAIALMDVATDNTSLWTTSASAIFRDIARARLGGLRDDGRPQFGGASAFRMRVAGGTQRLPEGMARALRSPVRFGKVVTRIANGPAGAEVTCLDGSRFTAAFVVCALPFSTLRHIDIVPAVTGPQAEAIAACSYGATSHVFVEATAPFWKEDGFGPGLYTDGPLERVFTPPGPKGEIRVLRVWANGLGGDRLDQLPPEQLGTYVIREIERMRPAAKGKLRYRARFSWTRHAFAQGHKHVYMPGQVTRFARQIDRPWQRIHFAGEHLRRMEFGMEAAMETGERAALEVLERAG
jgi:monoamine oxidase